MDITHEITPAMWEEADLDQRRMWRARAWLVGSKLGPNYPYQRDPIYDDLRGPEQAEVEQAGRLQLGTTTAAEAAALAQARKKAAKRKKAA